MMTCPVQMQGHGSYRKQGMMVCPEFNGISLVGIEFSDLRRCEPSSTATHMDVMLAGRGGGFHVLYGNSCIYFCECKFMSTIMHISAGADGQQGGIHWTA